MAKEHIEVDGQHIARLIIRGEWLYGNIKPMPVRVFAINYDYYYELDELQDDETIKPKLNKQGEQYAVVWHDEPFFSAHDFPGGSFINLQAAKAYATRTVKAVNWDSPLTENFI